MYIIRSVRCILPAIVLAVLVCAAPAEAARGNRIDATHILAREIELPERNSPAMGPISGVSYADINLELSVSRAPVKPLGHKEQFWVRNMANNQFDRVTAILRAVGKSCYVYVEDTQSVKQSAIDRVQKEFDQKIYPVTTGHFGYEARPGLDGEDRINLLMVDIQDGYQNPEDGYVAGYFFAGDQMLQSEFPTHSKTKSNQREILYIDTYPCDPEADDYLEIVAHEFQHMIHYNQDKDEVSWVNEGCSQIAPVFCGFTPPGHYKLLKEDPDRSLNNWAQWNPMPDYGQVYLWNQYIVDRLLHDSKSRTSFFKALAGSKRKSIGGYIDALKPFEVSFSDLFTDFAITNRINDSKLVDGRFAYRQSVLKKFKLPPTRHINTIPSKVSESVYVWGSDAFFTDIANVSGKLKVSFSGYRRSIGPTHPYFRVAVIEQDSTGIKAPKIGFFKLAVNPADKNRLIGSFEINCNNEYDSLTTIVMALAPENVEDKEYMPASGFIYDLIFEADRPISNIARAVHSVDMQAFAEAITQVSDTQSEAAFRLREHYANLLIRTIQRDADRGSLQTVDNFIESAGDQKAFAPFARDISGMLMFLKNQQSSSIPDEDLQNRIDFLNQLVHQR